MDKSVIGCGVSYSSRDNVDTLPVSCYIFNHNYIIENFKGSQQI